MKKAFSTTTLIDSLRSICIAFVAIFGVATLSVEADDSIAKPAIVRFESDSIDLAGNQHRISQNDRQRTRVFVFLSVTCPIANSYIPELNRIANEFRSIDVYGVIGEPQSTREESKKHFKEFNTQFPVLFDPSNLIAKALVPTHLSEVFVIDSDNKIVYRGAIDNQYMAIGKKRPKADQRYLRDALTAISNGNPIQLSITTPVGCVLRDPQTKSTESKVTFTRDIAPIIQMRCFNCHREGEVAPFELSSFEDVVAHADMITAVIDQNVMPPWIPGKDSQPKFIGERSLSAAEKQIIHDWIDGGCVKGNEADLPPIPVFTPGWQLGTPDLIVRMNEEFAVPADGPDLLQNFVIPLPTTEDQLVAAIEFHPGNKRVVHHAVLFLDDRGQARKLDEATAEPGYGNFGGPGIVPSGALGGWSPGNTARRLPNDMGRYLKKGSDLVVQIHYHPTGKREVDQSEIGIYFVGQPVEQSLRQPNKLVGSMWMANYEMDIPANESNYQRSTKYRIPKDISLVGIVPHMHLLGKSMKVTARYPSGDDQTLIDVPQWNYNWQDEYYYEKPIKLPAGTELYVEAAFDNSSNNPLNPSSPPKRVTWGEETTDEMLFCFFLMTADKSENLITVIYDNLKHDSKQARKEIGQ
jgi:hypothetical protein